MADKQNINTTNDSMVKLEGDDVFIENIMQRMDKETALRLAAHLVRTADPTGLKFEKIRRAVEES